ncbi:MAG TPA: DUF6640 family protein [Pseudolabrys sp.]|jgi:uncharacterized membrane protein|nr:DUF6640 family protein [Pseudolabrys sp.]
MSAVFDHNIIARILLTLTTVGWSLGAVLADFNATHATNPKWLPHARFHVVWQISSYVGFGLLALCLLWIPGAYATERLYLAAIMSGIVYAAFFAALFTMPVYGGTAYDKNGYRPFAAPIPIFASKWDMNVAVFCIQLLLLIGGTLSISASATG